MSARQRFLLIAAALLLLFVALAVLLLSRVDVKSRFAALASEATGLEVAVGGGASVGLLPAPHVVLREVTLSNRAARIASVGEADVGVALWPLLRRQVSITRLVLRNVNIEVERARDGHLNFAKPAQASRLLAAMSLGRVSLSRASFSYINRQSDGKITATDCTVEGNNVQLAEGSSADIMEHLSLSGHLVCAGARNDRFAGAEVTASVTGERGIFKVTPLTMRIMGGRGSGSIAADFTGRSPAYRVHYAVAQMHVDDLFRSLASGKVGEGMLDFTADLSMQGRNASEMTRTAQGEASLQGKNLDIAIGNLDEKLARYESSQNFNLVDVGAFLIAGPLGAAATKGHDFASILQGTKGNTEIRTLVSQWKVENGVAQARDVAMATKENRIAMRGGLDFVDRDFDDVTVAILDRKGCATVEQKVRGSFSKPEVEEPNVLVSLAGPMSRLVRKGATLLGAKCEVFYDGTVQQ